MACFKETHPPTAQPSALHTPCWWLSVPPRAAFPGGHQEPPAMYLKCRGRDARGQGRLVNEPAAPAVVAYPVVFLKIFIATAAVDA